MSRRSNIADGSVEASFASQSFPPNEGREKSAGYGSRWARCFWSGAAILTVGASAAFANPQGMAVVRGNVSAQQNGSQLNITASRNAVINWRSFNIGAGETTTFQQPSSRSVVWNQISDNNPSQI